MKRRDAIKLLGASTAAFAGAPYARAKTQTKSKPNIVYILADDLGYGDLGCYGQELIHTPHIDRLAREGMRFTQHYAGSTVCAPSRCVLMTGLHTGHSHIRGNHALPFEGNLPIPKQSVTVAELLKREGYATGAFGKWGLGYPGSEGDPVNQGFDYFFGYNCQRQAHSYYPGHLWRNTEKVMLEGNQGKTQTQYSHDLIADEALQFIRRNKSKPFFAYIPFTIPHTKFQVPDLGPYADKPWTQNQKIQAAMITRMDRDVGRILDLLKELNIDENTLLIFTSDNGPHGGGGTLERFNANGPLRGKKRDLYEGGIRVPMVARWPGKIQPSSVSDHLSGFQDMLPTFVALAGGPQPQRTDGISLVPTLFGKGKQEKHEYLYWEFYERDGKKAVRMGDWKAVQNNVKKNPDGPLELYDLKNDLGETKNIADKHQDVVKACESLMPKAHVPSKLFTFEKR
ncbi:sulfatase-like hydrolase/transferase [bacterium]|nr:sulfatase-like hydrolase/transferase [bacterium]